MKKWTLLANIFGFFTLGILLLTTAVTADDLPPRPPTVTPIPAATATPIAIPDAPPNGGQIILTQTGPDAFPPDTWTVVQWQNKAGDWYDVGGWQGTFNGDSQVIWWVDAANFGQGPFRWQAYPDQSRATLLATSDPFTLPARNRATVIVEIEN